MTRALAIALCAPLCVLQVPAVALIVSACLAVCASALLLIAGCSLSAALGLGCWRILKRAGFALPLELGSATR
jgi:hypothetical protein